MPSGQDASKKSSKNDSAIDNQLEDFEEFASEISASETKELLESDTPVLLIDCRDPKEHERCHIKGAILLPMEELAERASELEQYSDHRIIVYCHHGGRSLRVVNWLRNHGFHEAQNMTGGIDLWSQEVDPDMPRY